METIMQLKKLSRILICLLIFGVYSCAPEQTQQAEASDAAKDTETSIPVEAYVVKKESVQQSVNLTGVLQAIHSVDIVSEVSGKVVKIEKELGQYVSPKDTLAFIDHKIPFSQYKQAEAQYFSAKNNLQIARLNLESDRLLFENGDISSLAFQNSELAFKNAEAALLSAKSGLAIAEKGYLDTRITSPFSGLISRSYIDLGQMVQPGMPLYHVVDLSTLKIEAGLPQDVVGRVSTGAPVEVGISALGNGIYEGIVKFISPQADQRSGNFLAEIHLKNSKESGMRAGMTAKLNVLTTDPRKMLTVPEEAVIKNQGNTAVYKIENSKARLLTVESAFSVGTLVVIEEGISEGDTVVTIGHKNLGVDSKVTIESIY